MTILQQLLFAAFMITCSIANAFWYRAKFLLRDRGFPVSLFKLRWKDLDDLALLIESEHDPLQRARFQRLRSIIRGFLGASLILLVAFFALHLRRCRGH